MTQLTCSLGNASRITGYTGPEGTRNYKYDKTNQLTEVKVGSNKVLESFSFDANGNRTMSGYTTGTGDRMTSDGANNYTYDGEENTLTKINIGSSADSTNFGRDEPSRLLKTNRLVNVGPFRCIHCVRCVLCFI